jgi:hypothetical protein
VGNQTRSKSLSPDSSPSPDCIPSGEVPDGVPHTSKVASRRLSGSRTQRPYASPFPLRQLGRPLREGELQLLTVLAGECASSIILLRIEADKQDEAAKIIPPPHITRTRKGGGNGEV